MSDIKIICGDSLEVMKTFSDNQFDLVLTDIPYGEVNRDSNGLRTLDKGVADIEMYDHHCIASRISEVVEGSAYIFCGTEQVSGLRREFKNRGFSTRHCFWWKTNPSPMNGEHIWLSAIENCIFAKHNQATFNRHCEPPVWRYPSGQSKIHPTQKPLDLFIYLLESSTNEGDTVLDPFLGSGTTAVACERMGRNCVGIEISPEYCEIARRRVQEEKDKMGLFNGMVS